MLHKSILVFLIFYLVLFGGTHAAAQDNNTGLPEGIDPVTLSRLPPVYKKDLDDEGQRIFELVLGKDREMTGPGPAGVSFYNPSVAEAMHILNQALRYKSVIGRQLTEVVILVAAREFDQQYEWSHHEVLAREEGVSQEVIDTIRYNHDVDDLGREEALVINMGRQLMREHRLEAELFNQSVAMFGRQGTFEIAAIIGDYVLAGIMLHAVDQQLEPEYEATLPE